jgi:molecular chaperone GrpE
LGETAGGARSELASLHDALLGLDKQIGRAGREQLKANSIAEAQAAQLAAALEQLRAADARREAELKALCEQSRGARAAARLELAQDLLPVLDGLDEALRAARPLLAAARQHTADRAPAAEADEEPELGGWLRWLLGGPPSAESPQHDALRQVAELEAGLVSWLAGLAFIRQRLLDVLAAEDVRPIAATSQPFDPNYHLAMGVAAATEDHPAGTVVEELRRGYLAGERILRHAEVIVAAGEEHLPRPVEE